jgi:hypothetical protein
MYRVGSGDHKVAGDMGGENVPQGKKADEVDDSRNNAEQSRQAALQPRRFLNAIRRDSVLKRGGTSSER